MPWLEWVHNNTAEQALALAGTQPAWAQAEHRLLFPSTAVLPL